MTVPRKVSGWTIDTFAAYSEALRESEEKFQAEREKRYTDVDQERERAMRIKEKADEAALYLAREIQTYKDTKANELREQISSERGLYATKTELAALGDKFDMALKPIQDHIAGERGRTAGTAGSWALLTGAAGFILALIAIGSFVFRAPAQTPPQVIMVPAPQGTMIPTTPPQATPGR